MFRDEGGRVDRHPWLGVSMDLRERLKRLDEAGLSIPTTVEGTAATVVKSLDHSVVYYARTVIDGQKKSIVGTRDSLDESFGLYPKDTVWTLQRAVTFLESGAALVLQKNAVVEVVQGNPIALLRRGVLGMRVVQDGDLQTVLSYQQGLRVAMTATGLREDALGVLPRDPTVTAPVARQLTERLRRAGITGLIEWGLDGSGALHYLDFKALPPDELAGLHAVAVHPPTSDSEFDFSWSRPDLEACPTPLPRGATVKFETGARLAHVVSRSVHQTSIEFGE